MATNDTKIPNVAEVKGMIASLAAATLSGTVAQRQAVVLANLSRVTLWQETNAPRRLLTFSPGDTVWRTTSGADPDAAAPPAPPADDGRLP